MLACLSHIDSPMGMDTKARKDLIKTWGFTCTCPICVDDDLAREADKRLARIAEIREAMEKYDDISIAQLEKLVEELLELITLEGLEPQMGSYYQTMATIYLRDLDFVNAKKYAEMARESWVHYGAWDHWHVRTVTNFLRYVDFKIEQGKLKGQKLNESGKA
jgi:hypothetical protein